MIESKQPSRAAMEAAVQLEIEHCIGAITTRGLALKLDEVAATLASQATEHYEGMAVCGPLDGCEIEADGPSVPDEQGGHYNYVAGHPPIWSWVPAPGTKLHVNGSDGGNGAGGTS
jgi:hypothetical protein